MSPDTAGAIMRALADASNRVHRVAANPALRPRDRAELRTTLDILYATGLAVANATKEHHS